ncbi:MAG: alpha/beta hydrolase fold domain-containing protein, partial [Phaeodactylibacter sp.]|nr:alpha/beta hydrolase fold domain-containing protein [Phaeodactylibacter sp.]
VADGREAVRLARKNASRFGIDPNRIGMLGFSAGGTLIGSVAQTYDAESRPDFAALIYAYCGAILGDSVPEDAPPLFLALAGNDPIAFGNPALYEKWRDAGRPAELHIYPEGGHGFALQQQGLPVDLWTDRYLQWLQTQGLLLPPEEAKRTDLKGHWRWRRYWEEMIRTDFGGLNRFSEANQKLMPPEKNEKRIVFFGNSITEGWIGARPEFFEGKPYVNRGIGGQTTPQMLIRFRQDVVALKPAAVVILAGTNDIAGNTGPTTLEAIFNNIVSMAEIARANDIRVVISSVLPVADYPWAPGLEPAEKIIRLNAMLKKYAASNDCIYLDYHSAMKDERNGLPAALASDGVHPTVEGYKMMEGMVEQAINEAINVK